MLAKTTLFFGLLCCSFAGVEQAQSPSFSVKNQTIFDLSSSHARSYSQLGFCRPWHQYTCSCMSAGGVIWFGLTGLWPRGRKIFSFSVNNFSFHHQLSNELIDDSITNIITHSVCTYNIILILEFLLVIEMQMSGRVIFCLAELDFLHSNSEAKRELRFNSMLSFSFVHYYLALESQPLVVFTSLRT